MSPLLLLALGASPALAHRPHDLVVALAAPPDLVSEGRAWLVQDPHDISTLMVSTDFGAHWDFVASPLQDDDIIDGAATDDRAVFLAADGTLWSSDDGESWLDQDPPFAVEEANALALAGDRVLVATRDGVLAGSLDDVAGMTQSAAGAGVRGVAFAADDPSVAVAVTRDPALWRSTDGGESFTLLKEGMPGGRSPWAVAEVGGVIYVGTDHSILRISADGGSWDTCETLPVEIGGEYANDVPVLIAQEDGRLLATSGEQAIFVSDDGCESWTLLDTGVDVEYGGVGNAQSADEAFAGLYWQEDLLLVAGFQGLSWSEDEGSSWADAQILPEDYCKGVALSPGYPEDRTVFRAGYGGGVGVSSDGGQTWAGSAVGVESAYSNDVSPAHDFQDSGVVYYAGSNDPYRSEDGGQTWAALSVPMERVRRFRDMGERLYVLGEDASDGVEGRVAWSEDRGDTWTMMDSVMEAAEEAAPRDLFETTVGGQPALVAITDQPASMLVSTDAGERWTRIYEGEAETAAGGVAWPPGVGSRLLFASTSVGVVLSDDGGESWSSPASPPTGRVRDLSMADDGTLFLVNREGQFWRSEDGGDTWAAVGESVGRAIFAVWLDEGFAETGTLLLGTQDGVFWSDDRAESWHQLPRYQRLEADTHLMQCSAAAGGDCATYEDATDGLGGGYSLSSGDTLRFSFKGGSLRAVGEAAGPMTLSLGGIEVGTVEVGELVVLASEDWHDVTLRAEGEIQLDLVEVFADGEPLGEASPETGDSGDSGETGETGETGEPHSGETGAGDDTGEPPKDEGCGCSGAGAGPGGALGLLVGALALLRRRQR